MTIKNVKRVESNTKSLDASWNIQTFKVVYKYLYSNKNYQKSFDEIYKNRFLVYSIVANRCLHGSLGKIQ